MKKVYDEVRLYQPCPSNFVTGKNSFEIQIRKRRLISISKDFLLKNEVRRAYYHTWEERIGVFRPSSIRALSEPTQCRVEDAFLRKNRSG